MQLTTTGLVIKEVKIGENDRIITILTKDLGIISAIAKGSLRLKNKLFSSTGLFCYSEFTLFEGKTMYSVNEAEVKEVFFGVRQSIEGMALAMYSAELASVLSPEGDEAEDILRLLLNSLYFISGQKKPLEQIKIIFELKALCIAGYMPNLVACNTCAKYDGDVFCFDAKTADLFCGNCAEMQGLTPNLSQGALAAMRHIVFSQDEKLFAFTASKQSIEQVDYVLSQYIPECIDKPLRTLEFLYGVLN